MSNPWFRVYTEMVDDEKIRLLAFEDRWHYVAILCCKGKGIIDASPDLTMTMRKLSVKLGLTVREMETALGRLAEVGLVDAKTAQPLGWDSRQFISDTSTERVRAYRERMKRSGNVPVTAQDTDTDKDTEQKQKPVRSPNGSRLPPDWTLPGDWRAWAEQERPDVDVIRESRVFADYWAGQAGAKGRKADWQATWRNWIRRADGRARRSPNGQQPIGKQAQGLMALEAMKSGNRMAEGRTAGGAATDLLLGPGTHPRR